MPFDISPITDTLHIAVHPEAGDAEYLRALPTRLLLSVRMRPPAPAVRSAAETWVHLPCVDSPLTPIPMLLLFRGVEAAMPIIQQGGNVVVHCHYGRHRSVAMACCILIGQGYTAENAMRLVTERRAAADPYVWYIRSRIVRFAEKWT